MLLAREFGWTLDEMRQLKPSELVAILQELQRQKTIQEYHEMRNKWAFLAAVFTNGISALAGMFGKKKPKQVEPDAFISKEIKKAVERLTGKAQQEEDRWAALIQEAKAKGLKGPW
ncbi:hypothetical protein SAMN00808754_1937 [Thermanaeromonas toyohensis ToBE]|uniref:Uncharacterized protein n=1 Tax=Thermanaeromonas toyohensis ToBE TaxID=698762 RepID=A0A1W1VWM5_9FIRM|nr:hypothetical protein [Thermanaeromonas toyohensis]SMB97772.1 hypothetical protein SAMN00808754_1937 [Thermanaeromonas toyohensis ToBE]